MSDYSERISFDSTIARIIQLNDHVECRKKWCAEICHDVQLLIKTGTKIKLDRENAKTEEKPASSRPVNQEQPGDHMTPKELEELRLIEDALKKAGKTRKSFQAKSDDTKYRPGICTAISLDDNARESVKCLGSDIVSTRSRDYKIHGKAKDKMSGTVSRQGVMCNNHPNTKEPVFKTEQSTLSETTNAEVEKSSDAAVISQSVLDILRTSTLSNSKSLKCRPGKKPDSLSGSSVKYKPAHVTAPFKTVSDLRPISRTTSVQAKLGQSRSVSSLKNKTDFLPPTSFKKSSTETCKNKIRSGNLNNDAETLGHDVPSADPCIRSSIILIPEGALQSPEMDNFSFNKENLPNATERVNAAKHVNATKHVNSTKQMSFYSLENGCTLKLPSELSKAMLVNNQIREKLKASAARPRKLREAESSSADFMRLLQKHLEDVNPILFLQIKKYNHLSDTFLWLKKLLETIKYADLSDDTSASTVIQAQKILDFVLSEFDHYEGVLQSSLAVLPPAVGEGSQELNLRLLRRNTIMHWLDYDLDSWKRLDLSQKLMYRSQSQLMKYTTLVHDIQLLQLQKLILDDAGNLAIKSLNLLNSHSRLFPQLYQAFYSLLCSVGQSFPAVVRNFGDEDEQMNLDKASET